MLSPKRRPFSCSSLAPAPTCPSSRRGRHRPGGRCSSGSEEDSALKQKSPLEAAVPGDWSWE
eukprot:8330575-Heterocapsa_arctica.AAC.1